MALEAVVFQQDPFGYGYGGDFSFSCAPLIHDGYGFEGEEVSYHHQALNTTATTGSALDMAASLMRPNAKDQCDANSSSQENCGFFTTTGLSPVGTVGRRKRRRIRRIKDQEEVEHQRMTHITVERNRRKQMKNYLSMLRSMMPPSYVQRGDQASIVGGAINYVKELEQLLQSLEAKKQSKANNSSPLFSNFFTFPQYSTLSTHQQHNNYKNYSSSEDYHSVPTKLSSAIADVEVTMTESHANLKVLSRKHPKQLLKMVAGLYTLGLNILHLNVTTVDDMVLHSFSVKVEDNECQVNSVNEIAAAVYEMVVSIQEESTSNFSCDC